MNYTEIDDDKCVKESKNTNKSTNNRQKSFAFKIKNYDTSLDIIGEIVLTFVLVLGTSGGLFILAFCYLQDKARQPKRVYQG